MAARREQWESWLLAGRSVRLITDGDVPEEDYLTFAFFCVWVARCNAKHLLGNELDPVINWMPFSAEAWQMLSCIAGNDPGRTICVNSCEDSQTNRALMFYF